MQPGCKIFFKRFLKKFFFKFLSKNEIAIVKFISLARHVQISNLVLSKYI